MLAREQCWKKAFGRYKIGVIGIEFTEHFLFGKVKGGEGETRLSFLN